MKYLLIAGCLFGWLVACGPAAESPAAAAETQFRTTQPSHLYFKNIRSSRYQQETQADSRLDLYQLRASADTEQRPILHPVIVDNWMADEAYLQLEPNAYEGGFTDTLRVAWRSERDSGQFELARRDWPSQFRFAQRLYKGLQAGQHFRIQTAAGGYARLLEENKDRQNFLTTLRAYNKLIEHR